MDGSSISFSAADLDSGKQQIKKEKEKKTNVVKSSMYLCWRAGVIYGSLRRNVFTSEKKLVKAHNPR
jgi:hypothetical protein